MTVKMSATLPKDFVHNGLSPIHRDLVTDPDRPHVVIAVVDCGKSTIDHDTGETSPTLRVLRIEAVRLKDLLDAEQIMRSAHLHRTGKSESLPLDIDDELAALLRRVRGEVDA